MKKIVLFLAFFTVACVMFSQNVDSLVNVLNTQKLTVEDQLDIYDEVCAFYKKYDVSKAFLYAQKGLDLAQKEKDKKMLSYFYGHLGEVYITKGIFDTSFMYLEKSLDLALEINNKNQEGMLYGVIGNAFNLQSKQVEAIEYYMKALPIFESLGNKKSYLGALCNIGSVYYSLNNFERAIYYFNQAGKLAEELNDDYGKIHVYYYFGLIYMYQKDFDKALEYDLKTLEISRALGHKQAEALSLQSIAYNYCRNIRDYDKAEMYAMESLNIAEEYDNPNLKNSAFGILSVVYLYQQRYKECDIVSTKVWEADSTNLSTELMTVITANIASANIFLNNPKKATYFMQKYLESVQKFNETSSNATIVEMGVKYETEKKEMQIETLEKEKKLYGWLGVAGLGVLLLAFGLLFYRNRMNVQKRKLSEQQVKQLEQEKQLIATQAVLDGETAERSRLARDLHDGLGGMLSVVKLNLTDMKDYSIMDSIDVNRFHNALDILDQSIGELRRVAHHIMPESLMRYGLKVSLEDFCHAIPGAHFQYLGEDPRLDNRLEVLIYRCAYELINNAVKHSNATNINVQLIVDNGLVSLTVQDNGDGFDPEIADTSGRGLKNIRSRVSAFNGKMSIYSAPGKGTEVSIEIEKNETK